MVRRNIKRLKGDIKSYKSYEHFLSWLPSFVHYSLISSVLCHFPQIASTSTSLLFSPQLLSNKHSLQITQWTPLLRLFFSKEKLYQFGCGGAGGPGLPPSAGVYGIRYAWKTLHLTEGFSHVFSTVTKVCGFKQILRVSVRLVMCTSCTVCLCVCHETIHHWP